MEETLSTLDYALRAKSIRNKPEVNQRMTRNALLKEYVGEIERLKADVMAAREKNGIFFSEENWNKINTEHELKVTEAEESRRQIEVIEGQLKAVREEFEQSMSLLMKTDGELKQAKEKLEHTEKEVERKDGELAVVKGVLEEEVVVRQAHQKTELVMNGVSMQLKKVARDSVSDLGGIFDKLGTWLSQSHLTILMPVPRP
jgi:kinesin family protein 11